MKALVRISKIIVDRGHRRWWCSRCCSRCASAPSEIGVRQSATSGVLAEDLGPGWHWRIPGVHKLIVLPSNYFMLDYTEATRSGRRSRW